MKKNIQLNFIIIFCVAIMCSSINVYAETTLKGKSLKDSILKKEKCVVRESNYVYIFCYFIKNGEDGLHLAYSKDGFNWSALFDNKSILKPMVGDDKLMRDPCIIRGKDGKFHMVWTVSWKERSIGYANSTDLIHWSEQQNIPVMANEPTAQNCWAPEIFFDSKSKQYLIYWATSIPGRFPKSEQSNKKNHRMYYVVTKDFKVYSETRLLYDEGFSAIDATIQKDKNKYVMFIKDEREINDGITKKKIFVAFSDSLYSGYRKINAITTDEYAAEGPTAIKVGNRWIVYFDKYMIGKYGAVSSTDLVNWTDISSLVSFPSGIRHGTVFLISKNEFEKIQSSLMTDK
jgi:hypothetical protein